MYWSRNWLVDFNAGKTQLISFDWSNNTGATDVKMGGTVLLEKSSFEMLGLSFFSKLDWGSYINSIAKTASKKIGALICSMFLFPEVLHGILLAGTLAGTPSCNLKLSDKLRKQTCTTAGP